MPKYRIIGVCVNNRKTSSLKLQEILSKHGHFIKARLGLHETKLEDEFGLVILHVEDNENACKELINEINSTQGLLAKELVLDTDEI
ncbi:MAG: hypothetical protein PWP03_482 [Candidatus Woesearchaeota archaeon]|nr:hypothetical protein [Candidatus Woesearchaeota archaeon]MDN5327844.1 hypothetical protein [Candidatus Woesearchaeota archaeon]